MHKAVVTTVIARRPIIIKLTKKCSRARSDNVRVTFVILSKRCSIWLKSIKDG